MKAILLIPFLIAVALAGTPASPQEKVDGMFLFPEEHPFSFETLYGSAVAFATLKAPERIEVYRISPLIDSEPKPGTKTILGHKVLGGPVVPASAGRAELVDLFTAKGSFGDRPLCGREPGVLVRASAESVVVDVLFCFKCRDAVIVRNDGRLATFDPGRVDIQLGVTPESARKFLRVFQGLFPDDKELREVKIE